MRDIFKPLSEIMKPDLENAAFVVFDPSGKSEPRPLELADRWEQASQLELPDTVPEPVRRYFDMARMLWVYGWFCYPFYTWAAHHGMFACEMALRLRFKPEDEGEQIWLGTLLNRAVESGIVKDEGFTHVHRLAERRKNLAHLDESTQDPTSEGRPAYVEILRESIRSLRNAAAHPDDLQIRFPAGAYLQMEICRDFIKQLFP